MIRSWVAEPEVKKLQSMVEKVIDQVKAELRSRLKEAGLDPSENLYEIDGVLIDVEVQGYGLPNYRTRRAILQNDGTPLVQVSIGDCGRKVIRRMKVDGSLDYEGLVKHAKFLIEDVKRSKKIENKNREQRQQTREQLQQAGIRLSYDASLFGPNLFSPNVTLQVREDGGLKVQFGLEAGFPQDKLQRLIDFLVAEFPRQKYEDPEVQP